MNTLTSLEEPVAHLRKSDPVIGGVIDQVGPIDLTLREEGSHFETIVRSIIFQQLSGASANAICRKFMGLFGGRMPRPEEVAAHTDEALRGAGLSPQKLRYIRDFAAKCDSGVVKIDHLHELPDQEIIDELTLVKGIGVWTVQMFLIFRLGRPDVLPHLDLGVRKGIQRAYGLDSLPDSEQVQEIGEPWKPYRTVGSLYMWRILDSEIPIQTPQAA